MFKRQQILGQLLNNNSETQRPIIGRLIKVKRLEPKPPDKVFDMFLTSFWQPRSQGLLRF